MLLALRLAFSKGFEGNPGNRLEMVFPNKCYYCTTNGFGSTDEYERHIVIKQPNLPGYPGHADIIFYGLEKQGMPWELEIKNDIEWN